ncbi:hypothetical protein [Sphingomonas sp.]|uniref:hypothetical protein n=1 Tax=Sphingomonas sp. TaxID=28214 RepID=UPI003B3B3661
MVRSYYQAVGRHDYRAAHALWNGGRSVAALARGYARTRRVAVETIPPYPTEGAAGSVYCVVKVRVRAELDDGTPQRFAGSYTLRRVNDVDGSTAAQRRWHIVAGSLKAQPADA